MSQSIVQTQTDSVTLDQVRNRWKSIFETYADGGLAGIANFFGTGWSALNNPFIQNTRIKQINQPATKVTSCLPKVPCLWQLANFFIVAMLF